MTMIRKLILTGRKTYCITLPIHWIQKYNIKKGEDMHVIEKDACLVISNNNPTTSQKIETTIPNHESLQQNLITMYRQGYDEITLKGIRQKQINESLPLFPGLEIIEETPYYCKLQAFITEYSQDFEKLLKRLLFLITHLQEKSEEELPAAKENAMKLLNILFRSLYKQEQGSYHQTLSYFSTLKDIEYSIAHFGNPPLQIESFKHIAIEGSHSPSAVCQLDCLSFLK